MIATLRNTFNRVLSQLQTYFILKSYEKADFKKQAHFRQKEFKRIGENRYNMEAYVRLSIMNPGRKKHYKNSLTALGASPRAVKARLKTLEIQYPRASFLYT